MASSLDKMQSEVVKSAIKSLVKTKKALIYMATGTGKTNVAVNLVKLQKYRRVLWLTHQSELAKQTFERFHANNEFNVSLFTGSTKDASGDVVIATVQTLSKPANLKLFKKAEFDAIVVDEAHHSVAATWTKVITYFKCHRIALTATPFRPDRRYNDVFTLFGDPVCKITFDYAVENKFLAEPVAMLVLTDSVIDGMLKSGQELPAAQLEKLYTSMSRNNTIIKAYNEKARTEVLKLGLKPKTVCFCINIKHAIRMSKMFNLTGIKSEFLCADISRQSKEDRERIMNDFRDRDNIELLCVVDLFNEGIDIPEANIALMLRPTSSNIVYQQQIGRIARTNQGSKKLFYILDFVDNTTKGYTSYISTNLPSKSSTSSPAIITEYLDDQDEIKIQKRVDDIMLRVRQYEDNLWDEYKVTKENALEQMLALKKGKIIVNTRKLQ